MRLKGASQNSTWEPKLHYYCILPEAMILILQMYMGLCSLILLLSIEGIVENYAVSFLLSSTGYEFQTLNTNSFCKNLGQ